MRVRLADLELFEEYFVVDSTSPSNLRFKRASGNRSAGSVAGKQVWRDGEKINWRVGLKGEQYEVHHVILLLVDGIVVPEGFIVDHEDGDPFNNARENLRVVTQKVNMRNRRFHKTNTTGFKGVSLTHNHVGAAYYEAYVMGLDGRLKRKKFSVNVLGEDLAFQLAKEWRTHEMEQLNLAGAGYTERHLVPTHRSIRSPEDMS